jgi:O-antigen ligase
MVSAAELSSTLWFSGAALLLALGAILGLGAMLQFDRLIGRHVPLVVIPAMLLGIAISSALSGRDLKYASFSIGAIAADAEGAGMASFLLRVITLTLLALCLANVVSRTFDRRTRLQRGPGTALMVAFVVYYVCNQLINAVFGTVPAFSKQALYVPVVLAGLFVWRDQPATPVLALAKWALAAFLALSLIAAVLMPAIAVQPGYKGWVPGLSIRLWGLGSNPNSIGPLALLLVLLELLVPARHRALRVLVVVLAATVLVLAQSKTAWAAGFVAGLIVAWYRLGRAPGGGMRIGFALSLIALGIGAGLALAFSDPARIVERLVAGQVGTDVSTLTGRLQLWEVAIDTWKDNPLFGYGPSAWGPLHRAAVGVPFAFSAHNQFIQSLSVAGLLGLASLLAYMGWLLVYCWRAVEVTRGVSLALFVMVFMRCLTEAPFSAATLFNGDVVTQLLLFRVALLGAERAVPHMHARALTGRAQLA